MPPTGNATRPASTGFGGSSAQSRQREPPQDQHRLDWGDDPPGAPLATDPPYRVGSRRWLGGGETGLEVFAGRLSRHLRLSLPLRQRVVRSARTPAQGQTRPEAQEGETATVVVPAV